MAYKVTENENKRFSFDRTILNIVDTLGPISADEILLEIEEEEDCVLSRIEMNKHLEKMLVKHTLTKVKLQDDRVVYMMTEQ